MTDIPLFSEPTPAADLQNVLNILINEINGQLHTVVGLAGSVYSSRLVASLSEIPAAVLALETAGYAARSDGGGAVYYRTTGTTTGGFQSYDGAWWALAIKSGVCNVRQFGAQCDDSTDDTVAVQAAITAATAVHGVVFFPGPTYCKTTSALTVTGGVTIQGANNLLTGIHPATTIDGISINTTSPVLMRDFCINYGTAANAGTKALSLTSASRNQHSRFNRVMILQCYDGIVTNNASQWIIDACGIFSIQRRGITVQNDAHVDEGDSQIINSTFTGTTSSVSIYQESSGGLRVVNNKVLQADIAYELNLDDAISTADLFFSGNSIEGIVTAGLKLHRQGTTGAFLNVMITGNELGGETGVLVPADANGVWLKNITITGNTWLGNASGTNIGVNLNTLNGFVVANNVFYSNKNGTLKVSTGADADNGVVGPNIGVGGGTFGATVIGDVLTTSVVNGSGVWTVPAVIQ